MTNFLRPNSLPEPVIDHIEQDRSAIRPSGFRKISLLQLIAATYFMVSGGPYGLEDLVKNTGYLAAVVVLLLTPLLWSIPTALMVSELSSAVPEEGGYYAWVRRAMGPFWGFQEAWLSLAASIFDMAIYPVLFVQYLSRLCQRPDLATGYVAWLIGAAVIAACVVANIRGARTVGGSSVVMVAALLGPFVLLTVCAFAFQPVPAGDSVPGEEEVKPVEFYYLAGVLVAMWNYMGWDNASTFAGEVERPQRTYPLAMLGALLLVVFTYALPVLAAWRTGMDPEDWKAGSWVVVGTRVAGPVLGGAIGIGGMLAALGTFNSLVLSYSRVPVALAADGYLPGVFTRRHRKTGAPWVAILVCAAAWTLALQLSLPRLFALDVILYGLSLLLEFAALVVLRVREPNLARPFRVPGGKVFALFLGLGPALLIGAGIYDQAHKWLPEGDDPIAPGAALLLGTFLAALGPVVYFVSRGLNRGVVPALEAPGELRAPDAEPGMGTTGPGS
jgi:amino acid transporter